jgi:eukaryotic-like serine/threonine-protein kinase
MRLEDLIGRTIGRYQIVALIGRGGMAAVYRARDTALLRDVALKVLYPQYTSDQALVERFQREAVVAAGLDHPHIVPIYDVGEADGLTYIAMKLLGAHTLADLLRERGTLTLDELVPVVDQIASALDYAHARGVVHRDIKPANILLEGLEARGLRLGTDVAGHASLASSLQPPTSLSAVLTDFGIARSLDAPGVTGTGVLIGTPDYMAPEQIRGQRDVDGRADVYALGVLIYRCLTGRRPFEGSTQEVLIGHLEGTVALPSALDPSLPAAVDQLVRRAMARRPEGRYATAGALADALRLVAGFEPQTPPPGTIRAAEPRAVVPRVAADTFARRAPAEGDTLRNDAATLRGDARPPRVPPAPPARSQTPPRPPERRGGTGLLVLGVLLALVLIGGGALLAQQIRDAVAGGPTPTPPVPTAALATPTTAPAQFTATPTVTEAPSATPAPRDTATPEPTVAPTREPTTPPTATRVPPTRTPTSEPATATPTLEPATATPTLEPATATPTTTGTLEPTPCPVALAGGFARVWEASEELQLRIGCPTRPEVGGDIAEQSFQRGSMYYFGPLELIYSIDGGDEGLWRQFPQGDLLGLPTPTPAPAPDGGLLIPIGGFGLVWGTYGEVRESLGFATGPENGPLPGARQPFERGTMLWSSNGLGRGPTVYVLYNDGTFERYADPNQ